jgi:hypothetical protein
MDYLRRKNSQKNGVSLRLLNYDLQVIKDEVNNIKKVGYKLRELIQNDRMIKSKYLSCLMENGNAFD